MNRSGIITTSVHCAYELKYSWKIKGAKNMRLNTVGKSFAILAILMIMTLSVASADSVDEKRESLQKMSNETLHTLYNLQPSSRAAIRGAAGYAVFSISDMKLLLLGGGAGRGLAVNNNTQEKVFMKTTEAEVGFGLGIKKTAVIFVFGSDKAFADFGKEGWQIGGQATVAATDSVAGGSMQGAISVAPDVWMYQMTDKGLEASLTVRGIRYYKDSELN
jgi:lipid-binding SYLF domain-containing protein